MSEDAISNRGISVRMSMSAERVGSFKLKVNGACAGVCVQFVSSFSSEESEWASMRFWKDVTDLPMRLRHRLLSYVLLLDLFLALFM